jgi:nicotinate phosphoribosyltransferase
MNTSADAPFLDCAYKLQEYEGRPRRKRSEGKATWPGRKQVFRQHAPDGRPQGDLLTLASEAHPGAPLLVPVMRAGRPVATPPPLVAVREHARAELAGLPEHLRSLDAADPYPVEVAPSLRRLAAEIDALT